MLNNVLEEADITVDTYSFASSTNFTSVEELFSPEIRIYFLNMYSDHARRVLCAVSHLIERLYL